MLQQNLHLLVRILRRELPLKLCFLKLLLLLEEVEKMLVTVHQLNLQLVWLKLSKL